MAGLLLWRPLACAPVTDAQERPPLAWRSARRFSAAALLAAMRAACSAVMLVADDMRTTT